MGIKFYGDRNSCRCIDSFTSALTNNAHCLKGGVADTESLTHTHIHTQVHTFYCHLFIALSER